MKTTNNFTINKNKSASLIALEKRIARKHFKPLQEPFKKKGKQISSLPEYTNFKQTKSTDAKLEAFNNQLIKLQKQLKDNKDKLKDSKTTKNFARLLEYNNKKIKIAICTINNKILAINENKQNDLAVFVKSNFDQLLEYKRIELRARIKKSNSLQDAADFDADFLSYVLELNNIMDKLK